MIWSYIKSGNTEKCYDVVIEALEKFSGNEYILYAAFHAYHGMEPDTERERIVIEMMEHVGHRSDQLYECRGLAAEKEGRFADAYELFCFSYAQDPTDPDMRDRIQRLESEHPEVMKNQ